MYRVLSLLTFLWCVWSPVHATEPARVIITVPLYPLHIEIFNSAGEPLVTRGEPYPEFKTLVVSVATDPSSPTGYAVPKDLQEAALELRKMLPVEFYERLLAGREKILPYAGIPDDPGVDDRISDLATFLHEIWGLFDEQHPLISSFTSRYTVERLVEILAQAEA